MKNVLRISMMVFFILVVVRSGSSQSVSGTAKYADNGEIVTTGNVKAYDLNGNLLAETNINNNGSYIFHNLPNVQLDIIIVRNSGEEDNFIPTFYPDRIDPMTAVSLTPSTNLNNIDLFTARLPHHDNSASGSTIKGNVKTGNKEISDAVIYVQQGDNCIAYGISDSKGDYSINNVPEGDYVLVIHRLGNNSVKRNISLKSSEVTNIDFNLTVSHKNDIISNTIPSKFSLSQNYPNPFNPGTVINYNIPANGTVSLVVFNSLGKEVKTLVNGYQAAGLYSVNFNASNIASGIYFYTLSVNDEVNVSFTDTKRMILIK